MNSSIKKPVKAQATPVLYDVAGEGTLLGGGGLVKISGTMVIAEQVHLLGGEASYAQYDIMNFAFNVGGNVFTSTSVDASYLFIEQEPGGTLGSRRMFLNGVGTIPATNWNLNFTFYNWDGTFYGGSPPGGSAASIYTTLAPVIQLRPGDTSSGFLDVNMTLTREAPVP